MEKVKSTVTVMCSFHNDAVAKAVSLGDKTLLCFSCALDQTKTGDKTIKEIDKICDGNENVLLEYLQIKQTASRKENLIKEYERKLEEVQGNLKQEVKIMYETLSEKIGKMTENTVALIESKTEGLLNDFDSDKKILNRLQKAINKNIEKVLDARDGDVDHCKSELLEIKKEIDGKIADRDSNPEGVFISNKIFEQIISPTEHFLGEVDIYNTDHYAQLEQDVTHSNELNKEQNHTTSSIGVTTTLQDFARKIPPKVPPKPKTAPCQEIHDKPKPVPRSRKSASGSKPDGTSDGENIQQSFRESKEFPEESSEKVTNIAEEHKSPEKVETKHEKARKTKIFTFDKKDKKKVVPKLENYEDVDLAPNKHTQAKDLINKSVSLTGLQFTSSSKFSKLVTIGQDQIGLLTTKHSTVVVAQIDGRAHRKTYPDGVISIAAMENNQLAILVQEKGTKIETVHLSGGDFETKNTIYLSIEISDVTGFDYSKTKSLFAIGTRTQQVIIDGKRKKIKSTDISNITGSSKIATTYDFEKERIYVLNMEHRSVKCVCLKNVKHLWNGRYDQLIKPKALCLYKDKLCVASSGTVTIFSAKDGTPIRKHGSVGLVQDCLGICVIDDVIVISSNSDNFEESRKLGFIHF
ncbi:uncharacterized protein LOC128547965 [Mercenaria mercenaria]|uniref:uncharacterized protein LOC128547965 n=1 Tax=Mercenaria mercenaria TaxID=6596 RepID=UPI00234E8F37|nr:uncharacterized protein LOC128547965 [Mercenaria mercenaria]XP_053377949.1 uncharacterized protein LOC128547965 [Mercenaria mercenaria]